MIISPRIEEYFSQEFTEYGIINSFEFNIPTTGFTKEKTSEVQERDYFNRNFGKKIKLFRKEASGYFPSQIERERLEGFILEYSFYKVAKGYLDNQAKPEEKRCQKQHWIPECFMSNFSINGKVRKYNVIEKFYYDELVEINSSEFKNIEQKDKIYTDHFEETLSKIETDYVEVCKSIFDKGHITVYDFIVLGAFFSILHVRTKQKINTYGIEPEQLFSSILDGTRIFCLDRNLFIVDIKSLKGSLPFSQNPVIRIGMGPECSYAVALGFDKLLIFQHANHDMVNISMLLRHILDSLPEETRLSEYPYLYGMPEKHIIGVDILD